VFLEVVGILSYLHCCAQDLGGRTLQVYYTGEGTPGDRPVGGISLGVETRALGEVGGEYKIKFFH